MTLEKNLDNREQSKEMKWCKNYCVTYKHVVSTELHIYKFIVTVFQLDFEIFRTIASFIKISSSHSLINKLIFIKFFGTIWEIGGQMSRDPCLAESCVNWNT